MWVAMLAHAFRVPVLICYEAYKFHERIQLDSICFNELVFVACLLILIFFFLLLVYHIILSCLG